MTSPTKLKPTQTQAASGKNSKKQRVVSLQNKIPLITKRHVDHHRSPPCDRIAKQGIYGFVIGQPVYARHPELSGYRIGKITGILSSVGLYSVIFQGNNQEEFMNIPLKEIQPIDTSETYAEGDKVRAYFVKSSTWMKARVERQLKSREPKVVIKFLTLKNHFEALCYHLKKEYSQGDHVFAFWARRESFLPAVIESNGCNFSYLVKWDGMGKPFETRPDQIIPAKMFEKDEEVYALWNRDSKFYPATVIEIVNPWTVKVEFLGLAKRFQMFTHSLRKIQAS